MKDMSLRHAPSCAGAAILAGALFAQIWGCGSNTTARNQTFDSPEAAVKALTQAVKKGNLDDLRTIFGPDSQDLIDSSDPVTARRNRQIFTAAVAEKWRLESVGAAKALVIGNEQWPFPIPIVQEGNVWRFDTAAGKEEVLARRIGRNELAAILVCQTYVAAQRLYARTGHDGQRAGLYALAVRSDPGRHNGLYWPAARGEKPSPLGDLMAQAAEERRKATSDGEPSPFHGYYFKTLTSQGPAASGGAKNYLVDGKLAGGFALVARPAQYDVTGVMTFMVNHEGVVHEKDLGGDTDKAAQGITAYNPDRSWAPVR